ncbi:MAG: DNA polymerase [Limnohabitans sp.]|nr:DNA polymerase [Limnohabitans sp.]
MKQEASGWPHWTTSNDLKAQYLSDYENKEGIKLEEANIEKNPGRRFIAKLMLNSFWGKLSQRPNMAKTAICTNFSEYWKIMNDDSIEVLGEDYPNEETVIISYKHKNDDDCIPGNTSVAISSFVTSYARLHLYKWMDKINSISQDRLLYFDTDSVIFIHRQGDFNLPVGDFLGDLTDEISSNYGQNAKCTKFVSLGPKNYGLEININGETKAILKTKGIRNDASTLDTINIKNMIEMANNYINRVEDIRTVKQWTVKSDKFKHFVHSRYFDKIYRCVSEKRRLNGNSTLPYGYCYNNS